MRPRRARALVLAPAVLVGGAAVGLWLWRRWGYRVQSVEREVSRVPRPPVRDVPEGGSAAVVPEEDGVGAHFHRRYQVDVADTTKSPAELISCITADIQHYVPDEIAVFSKQVGDPGRFQVGDEFHISIRSPWNGPVRVIEAEPSRFTFATLEGHLEAGQIRFEAVDHPHQPGALRFRIESWARSADETVDWFYDTLGLAKAAQQAMWTFFCERVADDCGGQRMAEVDVITEREADA